MSKAYYCVRLATGGSALISSEVITAFVLSAKNEYKVFIKGDAVPFYLTPSSYNNLRSSVTDGLVVDCQ